MDAYDADGGEAVEFGVVAVICCFFGGQARREKREWGRLQEAQDDYADVNDDKQFDQVRRHFAPADARCIYASVCCMRWQGATLKVR